MLKVANYKGFRALLVMATLALCVGCNKAPVEEPGDSSVSFLIDWSNIRAGAPIPSDAMIYLYPKSGGDPVASRVDTTTKANFQVKAGFYQIIMYNGGLQSLKLANAQVYTGFLGYLEPQIVSASGVSSRGGEGSIVAQADYLHLLTGASSKEIEVLENVPLDLTLRPRTATNTLRLKMELRSPREYSTVYAKMSGIATKIELFSAKVLGDVISSVEIPMNVMPAQAKKMLTGQAEIIGIDPVDRNPGSNILSMVLTPVGGGDNEVVSKDLTEALKGYENMSIDVEIVIQPNPDDPEKLVMEVSIRAWEEDPPLDFDVVPSE